jgi:hypothetical protein
MILGKVQVGKIGPYYIFGKITKSALGFSAFTLLVLVIYST